MPLTTEQANDAVRDGIRRALDRERLSEEEYTGMTIAALRAELEASLAAELPQEPDRLDTLGLHLRRRCRKKGWVVQVPPNGWYTKEEHQDKKASAIADHITSMPMEPAG
jgi:hypothetical protein